MSQSLLDTVRRALDEHLPEDARITTVPQLERSLTELAIDHDTSIVGSADYAAGFALVAQERLRTPTTRGDIATGWWRRCSPNARPTSLTWDSWTRTIHGWPGTTSSP